MYMSNNIDKIFYINLDKRTDRKEEIENELKRMDLTAERYPAIYTPNSGIVGCGYSHLNVLKLAKERGYKNVLIFEDDFEFIVSKEEFNKTIQNFFDTTTKYDVCMLSYIVQEFEEVPNNSIVCRILNGQTASGYIVNGSYLDVLIDLYSWAIPELERTNEHWNYANDHVWKKLQPKDKWYYLVNRIGKQRSSYSDNKMCHVDNNDGV
jgi:GR25 family glycosyltransferase involved in LPS biosynthesis